MASKAQNESIVMNPNWTAAQRAYFYRLRDALPILMGYLSSEIPVLDNHSLEQIVDETGVLKQVKKTSEKAEKAHVERLKARMGNLDEKRGETYQAIYRGGSRIILNQEACKAAVAQFDEEGIHINRLLAAIKSGQVDLSNSPNVFLKDPVEEGATPELNYDVFFTTAGGGRSLYVEPIS